MGVTIRSTKNYDLFELNDFNRDVTKVSKLEHSMRKHGWIDAYPLHCEKNGGKTFKIKAGHNRIEAAKNLGLSVKFVVCNDSASIHELENATKPWTTKDYLTSYVRLGRPEYRAVEKYIEQTGMPLGTTISLLAGESAGSGNKLTRFKEGRYTLGDPFLANCIKDVVLFMKELGIPFATNNLLVNALSKVLWVDAFSLSKFKSKLDVNKALFEKQPDVGTYLAEIEKIYNRANRKKIPLAFLALEESKRRATTFGKK